jgi:hypothetical protein
MPACGPPLGPNISFDIKQFPQASDARRHAFCWGIRDPEVSQSRQQKTFGIGIGSWQIVTGLEPD